ncbi:MAG: Membrane flavodoxin oxidoreductase [Candidatus Wolfebacteria bacterium GW2011_GWE1_48_7]|nr:MAG: Membrane flavodoxin oxidoreductase [Candidatus Wolfebacteria bacterium GW2011_GWE1_48_7]
MIIVALSLLPLLFWATMKPITLRFETPTYTLTSIGQIFGLIGMALFALTLVLGTRHPILEQFFDGINKAYVAHHRLGAITFSLLLFHPIVIALKIALVASTRDAALFLLSTDPDILWGTAALLSMILFLILTFFISFAYHKWRLTHQFLSVSFVLASIHTLVIYSDTQNSAGLYWLMATFIAIGVVAICYRTLAPKFFVPHIEYIVDEVRTLDKNTVSIYMVPAYRPIAYRPGQFVFISFEDEKVGKESHPFSLISTPDEPRLAIAIKTLGDHTGKFKLIAKNTVAQIEGPFGTFLYDHFAGKNQIWIAGGIGITPFIGMAKSVTDSSYHITIYYCVTNKAEAVFLDELLTIEQGNPSIRIVPYCSSTQGHISAATLQMDEDIHSKEILICGPQPMMHSLTRQLIEKGTKKSHIHTEEFGFR